MLTVSRRALLAVGGTGAAGAVLAAGGKVADQREGASQEELSQAELEAEQRLAEGYGLAASTAGPASQQRALKQFAAAARKRADRLRATGPGLAPDTAPAPDGGPDSAEALSAAARLANSAIAAHRMAAGLLDTTEGRSQASSDLVACAAELAAVDGFAGRPQAPQAFVTGGEQEPNVAGEPTTSTTDTSTAGQ